MTPEQKWNGPIQDAIRRHDENLVHLPPAPGQPVLPVDWFRRAPNGGTVHRPARTCPPHGPEQLLVTEPERRVLLLVKQGMSLSAASRQLGKHVGTAVMHGKRLRARFGVASLDEVVERADSLGLLTPPVAPGRHFWAKVKPTENSCWEWQAVLNNNGYGRIRVKPRLLMAHRVAYEAMVGPIPDGLHLDHLCRNRSCVNPDHLEPVSNLENWSRGNSPTLAHAQKTHCKNGHEFTAENTITFTESGRNRPRRRCRQCRYDQGRARRERVRAMSGNQYAGIDEDTEPRRVVDVQLPPAEDD